MTRDRATRKTRVKKLTMWQKVTPLAVGVERLMEVVEASVGGGGGVILAGRLH